MSKVLSSLNNYIMKLSKMGFVLLIGIYVLFLFLLLIIISPNNDHIIVPTYEHKEYAEVINPQIEVYGLRRLNDNGGIDLDYRITARLRGRIESNNDPRYNIERFQMSALTTTNRMYYFTERTNGRTPTSHIFTMRNNIVENVPQQIFLKLEYLDNEGLSQKETFREDMLELTRKRKFNDNRKIINAADDEETTDVELQIIAINNEDDIDMSLRIIVEDKAKKYHIDMQTWIVTEDNQILPFVGVYGYSDPVATYSFSNRAIINELNAKKVYTKLIYYVDGEMPQIINYYEDIANLPARYEDFN